MSAAAAGGPPAAEQPGIAATATARNPLFKSYRLLAAMVEAPAQVWGVRALAKKMGMQPSTVHNLLRLLEECDLVTRRPDAPGYELGLEFFRLANRAVAGIPMGAIVAPVLAELGGSCNETSVFAVYDEKRHRLYFRDLNESENWLRVVIDTDEWVPLTVGAFGLAILAFLPPNEQEALIAESALRPLTHTTITDAAELRRELSAIRADGVSVTHGRRATGGVGVASPVFDRTGRPIGSLGLTIPEPRYTPQAEALFRRSVLEQAARLSERLGAPGINGAK